MDKETINFAHDVKNVRITPETSVSFSLLALVLGLVIGGGVSYGAMFTKIDNQGQQIKDLSDGVKELSKSVTSLRDDSVRQGEINNKFVDALGDIKSNINSIRTDLNAIRRGQ